MKIYFCGSIRGGRQLAETYKELIQLLSTFGEVLTEHVGDLALQDGGSSPMTDREIHDRDLGWIRESHVVVAEVTVPSLGVGYEIGRALEMGKPVVGLFHGDRQEGKLSAMIAGSENIRMLFYQHADELLTPLRAFFAEQV